MALRKFHVEVTQADINSGERHNAFCCPVARAIGREANTVCYVDGSIGIGPDRNYARRYALEHGADDAASSNMPDAVSDFVENFDEGRPVKPFSFEIELDDSAL